MPTGRSYEYGWNHDKRGPGGEQVGGSYASGTHLEDEEALNRALRSIRLAADHLRTGNSGAAAASLLEAADQWADAFGLYAIDHGFLGPIEQMAATEYLAETPDPEGGRALLAGAEQIRYLLFDSTQSRVEARSLEAFEGLLLRFVGTEDR